MRTGVLIVALCLGLVCAGTGPSCRDGSCPDGRKCAGNSACTTTAAALFDDAVSFLPTRSPSPAHLAAVVHQPPDAPHLLSDHVALSFRTVTRAALLMYAHDGRGNFLQLEIRAGNVACKYNHLSYVDEFALPVRVDDGRWHHFRMESGRSHLDNRTFPGLGPPRNRVFSVMTLPYVLRHNENVRPLPHTPSSSSLSFISIVIGGLDRRMGALPAFVGCLARLFIAGEAIGLHTGNPMTPRIVSGCLAGCGPGICLNRGRCLEEWRGAFSCDCRGSWFSGRRCGIDLGRRLDGGGGLMVMLPSPSAMSVTHGKVVLRAAPRAGEVVLHLQRVFHNVVLFSPTENELSLVLQKQGVSNKTHSRVDVSLRGLRPPYKVVFTLWSSRRRISLQINDRISELASSSRHRRTYIDSVLVGDVTAVKRIAIGGLNSTKLRHFRGCLQNLQIFFEDSQAPLEFSPDGGAELGQERLKLTRLSSANISFCSGMPPELSWNNSFENVSDLPASQPSNSASSSSQDDNAIVIFWVIIVSIGAVMILSICVFGIIYTYYVCEKRTEREKDNKRTYRKVSSLTPDSLINSTGGQPPSQTVTSESNDSTIRPPVYKPYQLPYKPAYVATSLILREGKHMASAESDPDLGESDDELP